MVGFERTRRIFPSAERARAAPDLEDEAFDAPGGGLPAIAVEIEKDLGDVLLVITWGASEPDVFEVEWWSRLELHVYVRRTDLLPVLTSRASMVFDDATGYMIAPGAHVICGQGGELLARVHGQTFEVPGDTPTGTTFQPQPMANGSGGIRTAADALVDGRKAAVSPGLTWVQVVETGTGRYQATVSSPQMTLVFRVEQPEPPTHVRFTRWGPPDDAVSPGFCEFSIRTRLFYPDRRFAGRVVRRFIAPDAFEIREHPRGNLRCTDGLVPDLGEVCFFRSELFCM